METKFNNVLFIESEIECNGILTLQRILNKPKKSVNIYDPTEDSYDDSYSDYSDSWGDSW